MRIYVVTYNDQTKAGRVDIHTAISKLVASRTSSNNDIEIARKDLESAESGTIFEILFDETDPELLMVLDIE